MARTAAVSLGGYYPTPADLAPALAARLHAPTPQVFLDPCAGDGAAMADLASAMMPRLTVAEMKHRDALRAVGGYGGTAELPEGVDAETADREARRWDTRDCCFVAVELEKGRATSIRTTLGKVAGHGNLTVTEADAFAVWHHSGAHRLHPAVRDGILAVMGAIPEGAEQHATPDIDTTRNGIGERGASIGTMRAALTNAAVDAYARRHVLPFVSVLYLNPPYDLDPIHGRLEQRFLRRFTGSLRPGGVLVFLVPHYALKASAEFIATHYRDVRCLRFPPAHFGAYRQVVLYGVRRGGSGFDLTETATGGAEDASGDDGTDDDTRFAPRLQPDPGVLAQVLAWANADPGPDGTGIPDCPELTATLAPGERPYTLPRYPYEHKGYKPEMRWAGAWSIPDVTGNIAGLDVAHVLTFYDPWSSRRKGGASVSAQAAYGALTGRGEPIGGILPVSLADVLQRDYPVVMPPKPAHIAAGIAAGVFNGEALTPDGGTAEGPTLLVKGAFRREFATIGTRENKDGHVVAEERVQQPSLVVTVCDLATGAYHTLTSSPTASLPAGPFTSDDVARMTVGDLLTRYGRGLLATLRARCPVMYDPRAAEAEGPGEDGFSGAAWTMPPTRRPPYPAQAHAIRAMVKVLATGPVRRDGAPGSATRFSGIRGSTVAFMGEVGTGKCLKIGTMVLRYDGVRVPVESVRVGDVLMGPDATPRHVLNTTRGTGLLYRVTPTNGESWVCNDAHILTLVHTLTNEIVDVPVRHYAEHTRLGFVFRGYGRTKHPRADFKQFIPERGVDFPPHETACPVDPYFLGVWYGDGSHGSNGVVGVCITKPDPEMRDLAFEQACVWGLQVHTFLSTTGCPSYRIHRGSSHLAQNRLLNAIRSLYTDGTNFPHRYLTGSRAERLAFLAGLLDTDGHLARNCFEIAQKRKEWADGIVFLARSLGLGTSMVPKVVNGEVYWRIMLSGHVDEIPTRLPRKQANPRQTHRTKPGVTGNPRAHRRVNRTGITVESVGVGDYAGFELDGDGRFLLGDFTVTHNSSSALITAMALGSRRILVMCPPHLLDGWREQVALTCHHATVHVLRVPADVDAWAAERLEDVYPEGVPADAVSVGILSRETAKLGHGLAGVGRCPDCGFDSHGDAASRVLAEALSEAEKDGALAANAGTHAARIAQALAATRAGAAGGGVRAAGDSADKLAEGLGNAVATLENKRAQRIQRLTDTREDEEAEERNARLRVRCPAALPLRPRNSVAAALVAMAVAVGRWDTSLRQYAASPALQRAWTRLDAEERAASYATIATVASTPDTGDADRRAALQRVAESRRTTGTRRTLDAPAGYPVDGCDDSLAGVSATHRALAMTAEAMVLGYAERGSSWGGSVPGVPSLEDLWMTLALLPDSLRLDVVTRLQPRLATVSAPRYDGTLERRCLWGRRWESDNCAWRMAHLLAWSALLCASRDVAEEIAWTWPGYPGTPYGAHDPHDPRTALALRETARVELPHSTTAWEVKPAKGSAGDDDAAESKGTTALRGSLFVGPCAWRTPEAGEGPASMRLAAIRFVVRADKPKVAAGYSNYSSGYNSYGNSGYGEARPVDAITEAPITLGGTWRRIRAYLTGGARWASAPTGTPVDARLYNPDALVTANGAAKLPPVTTSRVARLRPRVRPATKPAGEGSADTGDAEALDATESTDDADTGTDHALDAALDPTTDPTLDAEEVGAEGAKRGRGKGPGGKGAAANAGARKARPGRCNAALYQAIPEPRRVALARYIAKRHPACFDFVVFDEAHEFQGDKTAQFMAFQRLADLGAPAILATGSVMNGYAESLFNLWQRFPAFREEFPREARRAFVERYGYIRVEVKDVDRDTGKVVEFGSVSDRVVRQTREAGNAPGVLPLFILRHLLPRAVTLHKTDLALSLPPCHQRPAYVEPDIDAAKLHAGMMTDLVAEVKRGRFQPGLAGKLFGMLSEAPSHLDRCTADTGNQSDGAYVVAYPASAGLDAGRIVWKGMPLDPARVLAKEAWMLRTIRREVAEGRRVMVLAWHVELMPRLQRLIAHCLADVLAPGEYTTPELPAGFTWRGAVGGEGDVAAGVDPLDALTPGYWSGLDPATGLPLGGGATGGVPGTGKGAGKGAKSTAKGPTLTGSTTGKGARGGTRPVFPTSLPMAAIDRLCPTLNAGKVSAADRIAWINERVVVPDAKVMVVQPVAVKTGINNLVHFSTQLWMQNPGCDATTYRQGVGRVDRIGQNAAETRVYLGVYGVKSQRAAHTLLLRKTAVALSTDGLDGEGALNAAGVGESDGAMSALTVGRQLYDLITAEG